MPKRNPTEFEATLESEAAKRGLSTEDLTEILDNLVPDAKSSEAQTINNDGHSGQLAYLLEQAGLSAKEILDTLEEFS